MEAINNIIMVIIISITFVIIHIIYFISFTSILSVMHNMGERESGGVVRCGESCSVKNRAGGNV